MVTGLIAEALLLLFSITTLCNGLNKSESKVLWPLHVEAVIDSWGTHSDEKINSGTILSFIRNEQVHWSLQVDVVLLLKTRLHAAS